MGKANSKHRPGGPCCGEDLADLARVDASADDVDENEDER
jgi:hypothetical protein